MATLQLARLTDTVSHAPPAKPGELTEDVVNFTVDQVAVGLIKTGAAAIAAGSVSAGMGTVAVGLAKAASVVSSADDILKLTKWMARVASGTIVSNCSPNVFAEGQPVATVGSVAQCPVPVLRFPAPDGVQLVTSGSPGKVFVNNRPVARVGDPLSCLAKVASGAATVFSG